MMAHASHLFVSENPMYKMPYVEVGMTVLWFAEPSAMPPPPP